MVIPELFRKPSLVSAVMRRSTFLLKLRLLREPGVVVTDVAQVSGLDRGFEPVRAECVVPVSGLSAVSARALVYAKGLGLERTRAVFFSFEEGDSLDLETGWSRLGLDIPLEVIDAPYRDLGEPFLEYLRASTADPGTVVNVVMPELVVRGTDRLLHNQRALYLKRLLLFEPRVILTSVPYQLL